MDIRQSPQYANYLKSLGWTVERIDNTNYFIKKIPIIGGVLKVQRPKRLNFEVIEQLGKKYRVFQIIVEPDLTGIGSGVSRSIKYHNLLLSQGFKLSKSPFLPTKTLQIDLTQTKEKIFNAFKKDARLALRKTKDLGFKIYDLSNIKEFRKTWKKSVKFNRYVPPLEHLINLRKSFPKNNSLFLASHNAGAIFIRTKDIAYYWQAFTNKEGRNQQTQYQVVWKGIHWAKKQGCKIFDFEGIYDSRFPNKSWLGFTHFKKSFDGYEVEYPGCYTKFRFPFLNSSLAQLSKHQRNQNSCVP